MEEAIVPLLFLVHTTHLARSRATSSTTLNSSSSLRPTETLHSPPLSSYSSSISSNVHAVPSSQKSRVSDVNTGVERIFSPLTTENETVQSVDPDPMSSQLPPSLSTSHHDGDDLSLFSTLLSAHHIVIICPLILYHWYHDHDGTDRDWKAMLLKTVVFMHARFVCLHVAHRYCLKLMLFLFSLSTQRFCLLMN